MARQVARFKLHNLSARYPHLLSPHAWQHAFRLPQDIMRVTDSELVQQGLLTQGGQWLLAAGWIAVNHKKIIPLLNRVSAAWILLFGWMAMTALYSPSPIWM